MGLGSFFKRNKKTDTPVEEENTISIDQSKCLNLECQKCISICQAVCPSEAISLQ